MKKRPFEAVIEDALSVAIQNGEKSELKICSQILHRLAEYGYAVKDVDGNLAHRT